MKTLIMTLLSCVYSCVAAAQYVQPFVGISVRAAGGYSYTGLHALLTPEFHYRRHCLYAGPQLSLSRTYFYTSGVWGLNAGYKYTVLSERSWSSAVFADLQLFHTRPYNPRNLPLNADNTLMELQGGIGLYYRPSPSWNVGLELGAGLVRERYMDVTEQESHTSTGMTQLVRLSTGILIWRK